MDILSNPVATKNCVTNNLGDWREKNAQEINYIILSIRITAKLQKTHEIIELANTIQKNPFSNHLEKNI